MENLQYHPWGFAVFLPASIFGLRQFLPICAQAGKDLAARDLIGPIVTLNSSKNL